MKYSSVSAYDKALLKRLGRYNARDVMVFDYALCITKESLYSQFNADTALARSLCPPDKVKFLKQLQTIDRSMCLDQSRA